MNRGDSIELQIKIQDVDTKEYIDCSEFDEIEVQFNQQDQPYALKKLKSKGEVTWDTDHLTIVLSQQDTFTFSDGANKYQIRLYNNSVCESTIIGTFEVGEALSNQVIGGNQ